MSRRLTIAVLLLSLSAQAGLGNFSLYFDDGYTDSYDSAHSRFTRKSCNGPDYSASLSLDKAAIKRLEAATTQVRFFRLPETIERNHSTTPDGLETIAVCGPCSTSKLKISSGRKSHTVEWECDCEHDADPPELEPLLREIRQILYADPAVTGLPKSSCAFY